MDEEDFLSVLDELQGILKPVNNTGASRDQLAAAVKRALEVVEEVYDELDASDEEEDDDEEDDVEDEDEEPVETEEETDELHV